MSRPAFNCRSRPQINYSCSPSLVVSGISQPVQSLRFHLLLLEYGKFLGLPLIDPRFGKKE